MRVRAPGTYGRAGVGVSVNLNPNLVPPQEAVKNLLKLVAYTDKRAASMKPEELFDFSLLEELGIKKRQP